MSKRQERIQQIKYFKERSASSFLFLLISADIVFMVLYFFWGYTSFLSNELFQLTEDHGYSEIFQYVKEFWIIILLLAVFIKSKEIGYIGWAILFTYLLCDDALLIHERVGTIVASRMVFPPILGIRPQVFGELAVTAISAILLLSLICILYLRGSKMFKKVSKDLLVLLLVIAFFGVFVDAVHSMVDLVWNLSFILVVIEDGGEMVAISLVAWYVFLLNIHKGHASFSLWNLASAALSKPST